MQYSANHEDYTADKTLKGVQILLKLVYVSSKWVSAEREAGTMCDDITACCFNYAQKEECLCSIAF